jgi:hypothetical protein
VSIDLIGACRTFAEVTVTGLTGQRGITSRVFVTLNLLVWNKDAGSVGATLHDIQADLLVRIGGGNEVLLGSARAVDATAPLRQWEERSTSTLRLAIELSGVQLDEFERLRRGGPFTLAVVYHGLATDHQGRLDHLRGRDQLEVSQSEWVAVLGALGHQRSVLVEVPLPDEAVHPGLATATHELAVATSALRHGRVRDAVGACRLALENLAHAVGEDPENYNVVEIVRRDPNLDKQARFALLRRSLTIVAHPAHHGDPNAAAVEWHYEDAVALVTQTTALLRYYSARLLPGAP